MLECFVVPMWAAFSDAPLMPAGSGMNKMFSMIVPQHLSSHVQLVIGGLSIIRGKKKKGSKRRQQDRTG